MITKEQCKMTNRCYSPKSTQKEQKLARLSVIRGGCVRSVLLVGSIERKALEIEGRVWLASHEDDVRAGGDMRLVRVRVDQVSSLARRIASPEDGLAKVRPVNPDLVSGWFDITSARLCLRKISRRVVGVGVNGEAGVCADKAAGVQEDATEI